MEPEELNTKEKIVREFKSIKIKRIWIFYTILIVSMVAAGKLGGENRLVLMSLTLNYFLFILIGLLIGNLNKKVFLIYKLCKMEERSE